MRRSVLLFSVLLLLVATVGYPRLVGQHRAHVEAPRLSEDVRAKLAARLVATVANDNGAVRGY
jgi:hypothetical protein